jgi:signal transduction histidine kinase
MKQLFFIALLLLPVIKVAGQAPNVDSLVNVVNKNNLTLKEQFTVYQKICAAYKDVNSDSLGKYAIQGVSLAEKDKNEARLTIFYRYAGISCFQKREYDTAAIYLDKAFKLATKLKDKNEEANVYLATGYMYSSQSNTKLQIEYQLKALSSFEALGDKEKMMEALVSIGDAYRRARNSELAAKYLNQAKDMMGESNNAFLKALIYFELGAMETEIENVIEYELKSIEFARLANDKVLENLANESLVRVYMSGELKDYDKALVYEKECYRIAEEIGSKSYVYSALTKLADIYRKQENYKVCEEVSLKAWATDSTNLSEARNLAYNIATANIYLGNKDKASAFLSKYGALTDQYTDKSYHEEIVEMETKYETEKKEIQIASLKKEKHLYLWLGGASILLALALGIALRQKIKSVQKEKQLISTRSVLDGVMGERARLARDLHDRLGGNLSAVRLELKNQRESMQNIFDKLDNCIEDIRRVSHDLMPVSLQHGIKAALEDFAAQFPQVHFHFFGEESRIDEMKEYVIYCCASELVNNSLRHSGAKTVNLQLVQEEKHISLTVQDDGCGFNEKSVKKGLGLQNIYDRITSCNGKIDIASSPGKGTEITIEIIVNT